MSTHANALWGWVRVLMLLPQSQSEVSSPVKTRNDSKRKGRRRRLQAFHGCYACTFISFVFLCIESYTTTEEAPIQEEGEGAYFNRTL